MSSLADYGFIIVEPPAIDVFVSDPFRLKPPDIVVDPITDLSIRVELPPLLTAHPPIFDIEVRISYLEEYFTTGVSFEDVITAIPSLESITVNLPEEYKPRLEKKLKELLHVVLPESIERIKVDVKPTFIKNVPDDLRERYTVKIKIRGTISPEVKEIIENRLTKEFRITRLIKRMEIVRDPRYLYELEILLSVIERSLGLRERASRRSRRGL